MDGSSSSKDGPSAPRRRFLEGALGVSWAGMGVAASYVALRYVTPARGAETQSQTMPLGPLSSFALGSARIVRFGDRPVLVVRDAHGELHALGALCPHLQCVVAFQPASGIITCGCHDGTFALSGRNIAGPPPRPLPSYPIGVVGDEVVLRSPS
jgi:cytochrome b6-f complex iron-sulfur subunit